MRLPQLKVIQDETREPVHCSEHDYCSECTLFVRNGGRCEGCTPKHRKEMNQEFQWCYQQCHTCTGYKATVTAVCCRSSLKNMYLDAVTGNPDNWNEPIFSFTQREQLHFKRKAIFYVSQKCRTHAVIGDALAKHKVVATNMKVVVKPSGKGFVSNDLHDYLSLTKRTKIVLTTMDLDDHLEAAFKEEFYSDPSLYEKVGVSYWMPLAFSTFGGKDARMHHYYQFCRTYLCMQRSQAHFVPAYYRVPGMRLDDLILKALEKIPQLIFNAQFLGPATSDNLRHQLQLIMSWHLFAPKHVAFWIVGASTPNFFHNVRKIVGDRDVYYISGKPLYMSLWGQRMKDDGNERDLAEDDHPDKPALVADNYRKFRKLVKRWDKRRTL
jgi:hypothetical protein